MTRRRRLRKLYPQRTRSTSSSWTLYGDCSRSTPQQESLSKMRSTTHIFMSKYQKNHINRPPRWIPVFSVLCIVRWNRSTRTSCIRPHPESPHSLIVYFIYSSAVTCHYPLPQSRMFSFSRYATIVRRSLRCHVPPPCNSAATASVLFPAFSVFGFAPA